MAVRARARARRVRIGGGHAEVLWSSGSGELRIGGGHAEVLAPAQLLHCDEIFELGFAARKHSRYCLHTSECMLPEIAMLPAERSRNDLNVDGLRRTA